MISMRIHSVIDVITNSSTEIYSYVDGNAINATYDMLDAVIKHSGGTQSARDLFTVTAGADPAEMFERLDGYEWFDEWLEVHVPEKSKPRRDRNQELYYQQYKTAEQEFLSNPEMIQRASKSLEDCEGLETTVHIVAKDGTNAVAGAVEKFLSCFHSEEYNC